MLIDVLNNSITSKPDVLQFAKDRKYEEAWIISKTDAQSNEVEIDNYLQKEKFETLIVEFIWNSQDDSSRFVLTLFLDKKCQLQDPKRFVKICLYLFYNYSDFISLINEFDVKVIGHQYLFRYPVDAINMGIFNHWLSVGPVDLWKKGENYNSATVFSKIKKRPEIEKSKLNYQGLLFRFNITGKNNGPYYGLKTPCCLKKGEYWIVDFEKIDKWIRKMISD